MPLRSPGRRSTNAGARGRTSTRAGKQVAADVVFGKVSGRGFWFRYEFLSRKFSVTSYETCRRRCAVTIKRKPSCMALKNVAVLDAYATLYVVHIVPGVPVDVVGRAVVEFVAFAQFSAYYNT